MSPRRAALSFLLAALTALTALPVAAQPCPSSATERCSVGCDELGRWVAKEFDTIDAAYLHVLTLDELVRTTAFIVKPPAATLVIWRERANQPTGLPDRTAPHWDLEEYAFPVEAAEDSAALGGWIYSTPGSGAEYVRVWFVPCPAQERQRTVGR